MEKKEAVKEKGPLSTAQLMAGWGEGLIDAENETIFTVTKNTCIGYQAQVVWLRSQLNSWVDALKKKAGVTVISAKIKVGKDYSKYISSGVGDVDIILKLSIAGRLISEKIKNPEMRKLIAGGFKKTLAQSIINDFPPPFDIYDSNFAVGVEDIIKFNTTHGRYWRPEEIKKMCAKWEDTIRPRIVSILVHKAVLKHAFYPNSTTGRPIRIHLEYLNEIVLEDRKELIEKLGKFLNEQVIDCHHFE